jgi:DNA-binding response OmpR family regulator
MRILVIDDDAPTVEVLVTVLEGDGHAVVSERTGAAGRVRAMAESWDLIICDIGLPDVTGFVIARQLRSAGIEVPLLALSGHASDEDRRLGLASGFDVYLTKPIKASVLREEVRVQAAVPRSARARTAPPAGPVIIGRAATPDSTPAAATVPVRRRRGVLGGLVVIALGVPFVLQPLGVPNAA